MRLPNVAQRGAIMAEHSHNQEKNQQIQSCFGDSNNNSADPCEVKMDHTASLNLDHNFKNEHAETTGTRWLSFALFIWRAVLHWYHSSTILRSLYTPLRTAALGLKHSCCVPAEASVRGSHKQVTHTRTLLNGYRRLARSLQALCRAATTRVSGFNQTSKSNTTCCALTASNDAYCGCCCGPSRHHRRGRCRGGRRVALCCLCTFLTIALALLCLLVRVFLELASDPYAELRVSLRAAYAGAEVEGVVRALRSSDIDADTPAPHLTRHLSHSSQESQPHKEGALIRLVKYFTAPVERALEKSVLSLLAYVLVLHRPDAVQAAQQSMASLRSRFLAPVFVMMGERPITGSLDAYASGAAVVVVNATMNEWTVGERMFDFVRAATQRCACEEEETSEALMSLCSSRSGSQNNSDKWCGELIDEKLARRALWNALAGADAVKLAQPQCLRRSQPRMPCADVGKVDISDKKDTAQLLSPIGKSSVLNADVSRVRSRVQHFYEHQRLALGHADVARLFYDHTPGLPAEAQRWRAAAMAPAESDTHRLPPRVRLQTERFLRTHVQRQKTDARATVGRPPSGVILFLSGAGDRNPVDRSNEFTQHALPLLEKNLLQRYPHYPVHIFYEGSAVGAASRVDGPSLSPSAPAWTLTDVLRHSDVYTVLHRWSPRVVEDSTSKQRNASIQTRDTVHTPPPPPILVDRQDKLHAMRRQHARHADWFHAVAARVPSAPYVTFENVAPLFSTLPCGVSEADVATWVEDEFVMRGHRRGYRQMCRFWARLVWRLPSLRVWTESSNGQGEGQASAGRIKESVLNSQRNGRDRYDLPLRLPPWRFRYAYYLRLDTDSFLHRPVACDPFRIMLAQRCAYGYNKLQFDQPRVTRHLGEAFSEWMAERTNNVVVEQLAPLLTPLTTVTTNATESDLVTKEETIAPAEKRGAALPWGRLTDPALLSFVTLVSATTSAGAKSDFNSTQLSAIHSKEKEYSHSTQQQIQQQQQDQEQQLWSIPPLPPTWPWPNAYPAHSSAALSASEVSVLRALFFNDVRSKSAQEGHSSVSRAKEKNVKAIADNSKVRNATQRVRGVSMVAKRSPSWRQLHEGLYNGLMYYNNFELGTFALKTHPLYTSLVDFLDNREFDDVSGPMREAAAADFLLTPAPPEWAESSGQPNDPQNQERKATVYNSTVFYLRPKAHAVNATLSAAPQPLHANPRQARETCRDRSDHQHPPQKLYRGPMDVRSVTSNQTNEEELRALRAVKASSWRSGYLQYRWGDAPVHTFGVEAVLQREGWSVCAFAEDFGGYKHGRYRSH